MIGICGTISVEICNIVDIEILGTIQSEIMQHFFKFNDTQI